MEYNLNKHKPPKTEEEFDEKYKIWKKKVSKLLRSIKKVAKTPVKYIEEYEQLMKEGAEKHIITTEFADEKIYQMNYELTSPTRFKNDVSEKIEKFRNKLRRKRKKKK